MAFVDAAELADDFRERDDFLGGRVTAGGVIESGREADSAGLHAAARELRHALEFLRVRRAIGHAEHFAADRAVRHVQRDVDADAALLEARALRPQVHGAAAIGVDRHGRDPLREQLARFPEAALETLRRVRVHVDEAGRDRESVGVDHAGRRRIAQPAHVDDAAAADAQICGQPRVAAAVEDAPVPDEHVVRCRLGGQ